MQLIFLAIVFALAGGVAAGFQGPLASLMSRSIGNLGSIFIAHLGGLLAISIILLFQRDGKLSEWRSVPWYALGAGVLGVVVIYGLNYAIPKMGAGSTIAVFVASQLGVGLLLDHFGLLGNQVHPITFSRVVGLLVLIAGAWLVSR
jgi:transporter family-2 protein